MSALHKTRIALIGKVVVYRAHCDTCGEPVGEDTTDEQAARDEALAHRYGIPR